MGLKKISKILEADLKELSYYYPKLKLEWNSGINLWGLVGLLDICDTAGEYWDSFEIIVHIPSQYPFGVPAVIEKSEIIPREPDRHIAEDGNCCLDIEHRLSYESKKGLKLLRFMQNWVYPYFANQLYFTENGKFAGEEYKHGVHGALQFYFETLMIADSKLVIKILKSILTNNLPGRNDNCICGETKKFKNCHLTSIQYLQAIDKDLLTKDISRFKAYSS